MASRYQDPDRGRVFYYYTHAHHKFDQNWDLRAGIIAAMRTGTIPAGAAGTKTKHLGRWVQLQYKGSNLSVPKSYGITLDYRYEPALSWPTVTDWCGLNENSCVWASAMYRLKYPSTMFFSKLLIVK